MLHRRALEIQRKLTAWLVVTSTNPRILIGFGKGLEPDRSRQKDSESASMKYYVPLIGASLRGKRVTPLFPWLNFESDLLLDHLPFLLLESKREFLEGLFDSLNLFVFDPRK